MTGNSPDEWAETGHRSIDGPMTSPEPEGAPKPETMEKARALLTAKCVHDGATARQCVTCVALALEEAWRDAQAEPACPHCPDGKLRLDGSEHYDGTKFWGCVHGA